MPAAPLARISIFTNPERIVFPVLKVFPFIIMMKIDVVAIYLNKLLPKMSFIS